MTISLSNDGVEREILRDLYKWTFEDLDTSGRLYAAWANDDIDHLEWLGPNRDRLVWFLKSGEAIETS